MGPDLPDHNFRSVSILIDHTWAWTLMGQMGPDLPAHSLVELYRRPSGDLLALQSTLHRNRLYAVQASIEYAQGSCPAQAPPASLAQSLQVCDFSDQPPRPQLHIGVPGA